MVGPDGRDQRCVRNGYCGAAGPAYSVVVVGVEYDRGTGALSVGQEATTIYSDFESGYPTGEAGY